MKIILTEQEIINTYGRKQQEQCRLYFGYKTLKKENPALGYKKLSKMLNQSPAKARWWNCGKHTPIPIQTVQWLKERNLIPLTEDNSKILLISKILGTMFGDGGIFGNLNGIFLSSSELDSVMEFGEDLKNICGNEIEKNHRVIEGGIEGHSWCYQNTNRNIIRFFQALGAPIGDKSFIPLILPRWIEETQEKIKDEFFGSFFGNEMGIPKVHISKRQLDTFSLGITATNKFSQNRIAFLEGIAAYLNKKGIKTRKIAINDHKKFNRKGEPTKIYRLLLSTEFENVLNFINLAKINYSKNKQNKLTNTMNEFSAIKLVRFRELIKRGYDKEGASNILNLSPFALDIISGSEDLRKIYLSCKK